MPVKPETSYPFVRDWFDRAATEAKRQGRRDAAQLWRDGLEHLESMREHRDELLAALQALEPLLDSIVCYASTQGEHDPNRIAAQARAAIDREAS